MNRKMIRNSHELEAVQNISGVCVIITRNALTLCHTLLFIQSLIIRSNEKPYEEYIVKLIYSVLLSYKAAL